MAFIVGSTRCAIKRKAAQYSSEDGTPRNGAVANSIDEAKKLAVECAKRIIAERKEVTSQDLYDCGMLKESFERGYLQILSTKYNIYTYSQYLKTDLQ
jgi:hypothetical protein